MTPADKASTKLSYFDFDFVVSSLECLTMFVLYALNSIASRGVSSHEADDDVIAQPRLANG